MTAPPDSRRGAVLALDAAGDRCAAALLAPGGALVSRSEPMLRGHAERLPPLIDAVIAEAGCGFDAVGTVAAMRGPGSFTGVRVGVAAARGVALAVGARAVGVDGFFATAEALRAAGCREARIVAVYGKAPRFVWRVFRLDADGPAPVGEPETGAMLGEADQDLLLAGPAAADFAEAGAGRWAGAAFDRLDIGLIARLARAGGPAVGAPVPLYHRPPDAEPSQSPRPARLGPRRALG